MRAFQSAKNNLFKEIYKTKSTKQQQQQHQQQQRNKNENTHITEEPLRHTCGKDNTEFVYTTKLISEESELKYVEDENDDVDDDEEFVRSSLFVPNNSDIFEFETDQNNESIIIKGDNEKNRQRQSIIILDDEKKELKNNNIKLKIEKLILENEKLKEINTALISKNDENSQYLTRTIDILQRKISELNIRLENHQVDSIEKEKSIKQLIEILHDVPNQLFNALHRENPSSIPLDSTYTIDNVPSVQKDQISLFPTMKINYRPKSKSHSIKVLCRVKPDIDNCLTVPTTDLIYLPPFKHFDKGLGYRLNKVFGGHVSQLEVFEEIIPILPSCFEGCNVCVITYGQSGSGKTHTMIGSNSEPGIMMLSIKELFRITNENVTAIHKFYLTILEIYNENIYDLMSTVGDRNSMNLKARVFLQDNGHSVQVKDVSEAEINKEAEFNYYINQSLKRRSSSVTARNISSSRSHYLVMIRVSGMTKQPGPVTNKGSLIMCDLAGSENCNGLSNKEQTESKFINKSITMLNRVFDAMYRKASSIPFRDSKLTHLLKPSLMGNAKCIFIATVCSRPEHINDTYRTLNVAKKVEMIHFTEESQQSISKLEKPL